MALHPNYESPPTYDNSRVAYDGADVSTAGVGRVPPLAAARRAAPDAKSRRATPVAQSRRATPVLKVR